MRVGIVFEGTGANYLEDLICLGLRGLFGQGVVWWPYKAHLDFEKAPKQAPEASCWGDGPDQSVLREDLLAQIGLGLMDVVLVGNPNAPGHLGFAEEVIDACKEHGVQVAMVDGDDQRRLDQLEALLPEGPWFVREAFAHEEWDDRIIPFSFAINTLSAPPSSPWKDRHIDVLWGGSIHYGRDKYISALESLGERVEIVRSRSLPLVEWNALLSDSKICVCLTGAGRATYRYFEAGAAGCIPVIQQHGLRIANDYPDFVAPTFTSPEEMLKRIDMILNDPPETQAHAAEEAMQIVWQNHTMTARAAELITTLKTRANT